MRRSHGRLVLLFVLISLLGSAGVAFLRYRDVDGDDCFQLLVAGRRLTFQAAGDKLGASLEDERQVRDPAKPSQYLELTPLERFSLSHDYSSSVGGPQRDDVATYVISMRYHPWFVPDRLGGPFDDFRTFHIERPIGPTTNTFGIRGYGVIVPNWWLATALAVPAVLWLATLLVRRRQHRKPGFPVTVPTTPETAGVE